jgi:hypothetical protein
MASCGNEDEKFEGIDFKTVGVKLHKTSVISYYGEVTSEGGTLVFEATGKDQTNGSLSEIKVGDFFYEVKVSDRSKPLPYTVCDEDWGKVVITSTSPHTTQLILKANESGSSKNIELVFGCCYRISNVLITLLKK